jgi:hypothetical protein
MPPSGNVGSGSFRGAPGAGGQIPAQATFSIDGPFTIVVDKDLVISGKINFKSGGTKPDDGGPISFTPGFSLPAPPPSITLVSLNGRVTVEQGAEVGGFGRDMSAAEGAEAQTVGRGQTAVAGDGDDGGWVKIVGVNVDIQGKVAGQWGGDGGWANAVATQTPSDPMANAINGFMGIFHAGGSTTAVGGNGGDGGDVIICATDAIHIGGRVQGGDGGDFGAASARADDGGFARAKTGIGGRGGDVTLCGRPKNCQIFNDGQILGGAGGGVFLKSSNAVGGSGHAVGGNAEARGGAGELGGTVHFESCLVTTQGTVAAGDGGGGGYAEAIGGAGAQGIMSKSGQGLPGGNADAQGGNGGPAGALPIIPVLPVGTTKNGDPGNRGPGGGTTAQGGAGGSAAPWGQGGDSGSATASGGGNGAGAGAGPAQTMGSQTAPSGPAGATAAPIAQAGKV